MICLMKSLILSKHRIKYFLVEISSTHMDTIYRIVTSTYAPPQKLKTPFFIMPYNHTRKWDY